MDQEYTFDLYVIGGGSGGLACAKAAKSHGAKVGLADFVKPSPQGTKWGIGGTCVNVGCIPKKLFHHASLLGESRADLRGVGWGDSTNGEHNWQQLSEGVTNYIRSINFGYRTSLMKDGITYHNKLAKLISKHQIQLTDENGNKEIITAKNIVIAVGGRPTYPQIPGAIQYSISSDDIFWLPNKPGKTLVVGASYIALQCAGYLHGLGVDVTVMVRSIFLRGFDQQMANKAAEYMTSHGMKFIRNAVPTKITVNSEGKRIVEYLQGEQENQDQFDVVMFATGRHADTKGLGLQEAGVKTAKNGKVIAGDDDKTSVDNIYAIGDCCEGRLQLTPTAILAAKLLANRLFNKGTRKMSYKYVPTTVFTPLEYGACGYSTEDAIKQFGEENIVSWGSKFKPLQWNLNYERENSCYAKLVVNKADKNRVVGFHILGPNAGEITQGFAAAILLGATKEDFDYTVGIHPTMAEQFTLLKAIAGSADEEKKAC